MYVQVGIYRYILYVCCFKHTVEKSKVEDNDNKLMGKSNIKDNLRGLKQKFSVTTTTIALMLALTTIKT